MKDASSKTDAMIGAARQFHFSWLDLMRRAFGDTLGALGLDPDETPYDIAAEADFWRLRHYGGGAAPKERPSSPLLIVPAPIKRPYIWDLAPEFSIVALMMARGHDVHLVEWLPATPQTSVHGIEDYAGAIAHCLARLGSGPGRPTMIGHSLGGTLAAIHAANAPATIACLVLLDSPLCFAPGSSRFRDALVGLAPEELEREAPVPGSLLSTASAAASPYTFVWSRMLDRPASPDPQAVRLRALVERWTMDEVALSGRLIHQIVEWLYRENLFCSGRLQIGGRTIGPGDMTAPLLAVITGNDEVAPAASVSPFLSQMPTDARGLLEYGGESGVGLQHLGILVGPQARAEIWPRILDWIGKPRPLTSGR